MLQFILYVIKCNSLRTWFGLVLSGAFTEHALNKPHHEVSYITYFFTLLVNCIIFVVNFPQNPVVSVSIASGGISCRTTSCTAGAARTTTAVKKK